MLSVFKTASVDSIYKAKGICPLPQIFIHFSTVKSSVSMKF